MFVLLRPIDISHEHSHVLKSETRERTRKSRRLYLVRQLGDKNLLTCLFMGLKKPGTEPDTADSPPNPLS